MHKNLNYTFRFIRGCATNLATPQFMDARIISKSIITKQSYLFSKSVSNSSSVSYLTLILFYFIKKYFLNIYSKPKMVIFKGKFIINIGLVIFESPLFIVDVAWCNGLHKQRTHTLLLIYI
jgi:hypothetical protein